MSSATISDKLIHEIERFLKKNKKADLVTTYLFFLSQKHGIHPVLYVKEKKIYQSEAEILKSLEDQGKLWRETEINIQVGQPTINEETRRIYICPVTGKVFGDNTHPNPQDAIYDWVSLHGELVEGVRSKRFYTSDDPEMIKNYITKVRDPIKKKVFSSLATGKLFNSKKSAVEDFKQSQLKEIPLESIPAQNRFEIESHLLRWIEEQLNEEALSGFVEALCQHEHLTPYARNWLEDEDEEQQ